MSALGLRVLACVSMLLDHIGYQYGGAFLRVVGRLAFPLYAFLLYNGFVHTRDRKKYALRMALFALLSQIPFVLFTNKTELFGNWNVMLTLLLALLCLWGLDLCKKRGVAFLGILPILLSFALYESGLLRSDYGFRGILVVLAFALLHGPKTWQRIALPIALAVAALWSYLYPLAERLLLIALGRDLAIPAISDWTLTQLWGLLALIPIYFYNGQRGKLGGRGVQYAFYAFYPAHMLLLWMLFRAF